MSKSSIDPELAWKTLLDNYRGGFAFCGHQMASSGVT